MKEKPLRTKKTKQAIQKQFHLRTKKTDLESGCRHLHMRLHFEQTMGKDCTTMRQDCTYNETPMRVDTMRTFSIMHHHRQMKCPVLHWEEPLLNSMGMLSIEGRATAPNGQNYVAAMRLCVVASFHCLPAASVHFH